MKTYIITRTAEGVKLHAKTDGKAYEITPKASQAIINHSPDGFEFGYGGSGPAQLALAILLDHFIEHAPEPKSIAFEHHQDFKTTFIAPRVKDSFEIEQADIIRWHGSRVASRS